MGIEPTYPAWKAGVLPLNYTRRMIGVTGFEPATSWSQTRRSSQAEPHPEISSGIHDPDIRSYLNQLSPDCICCCACQPQRKKYCIIPRKGCQHKMQNFYDLILFFYAYTYFLKRKGNRNFLRFPFCTMIFRLCNSICYHCFVAYMKYFEPNSVQNTPSTLVFCMNRSL